MPKIPLALFLIFPALCLNVLADTITLKDGTVINGTITQQDDNQVTVNIKDSDTISEERILKRDDISKIDKTSEDTLAFDQLKTLQPNPWAMLPPESCQAAINALQAFLAKYPQSSHKAEAQAILDAFLSEQSHEQAGDVKLYGHWISSKEAPARDMQIRAQALYLNMQASAAQGDLIGALNTFDQLEKNYAGARVYPAAIMQARAFASALQQQVTTASATLKVTDEQWKQGVAITPEPEKSTMIAARQGEIARYEAILAASGKSQKWPPYIAQSQKSLDAISAVLATDIGRLAALPVDKMNASIADSDKAADAFAANNVPGTQSLLKDALALWSKNEEATYLQDIAAGKVAPPQRPGPAAPAVAGARTPVPRIAANGPAPAGAPRPATGPKPAAPDAAEPAPAAEQSSAFQKLQDFLFTIPGAITVVVCAIGLYALSSYLQKSKRDRMSNEQEQEH